MIKPAWLRKSAVKFSDTLGVRGVIRGASLNTVCKSARCPNMGECYAGGVATFMILGDRCSRNCGFCNVPQGPDKHYVDPLEPANVAKAAVELGLKHIVITSVTRDDLPDGGADHFSRTIGKCRELCKSATMEVLIPDFSGRERSIDTVIKAGPDVFNHNIETVPELYAKVRPSADYARSLRLLEKAGRSGEPMVVKSGLMLGLGETMDQVRRVMIDLKDAGCDVLTIGQYLQPSRNNLPVVEYVKPEIFNELAEAGEALGIRKVFAGPFIRSSYHAAQVFRSARV